METRIDLGQIFRLVFEAERKILISGCSHLVLLCFPNFDRSVLEGWYKEEKTLSTIAEVNDLRVLGSLGTQFR